MNAADHGAAVPELPVPSATRLMAAAGVAILQKVKANQALLD